MIRPGTVIPRLTSTSEKVRRLQQLGIDEVRVIPFNYEFSQMAARAFFDTILMKDLQLGFLAVGRDFYFGHNREGTPGRAMDWCTESGIPSKLVDAVEADGTPISSSRIRKLIHEDGQMIAAARLLGRDYAITGEVVHGDKRGRQLGFPTANMLPVVSGPGMICAPAKGVYLSASTIEGRTFASITNVGIKPTVHKEGPFGIETHLLDFTGDLYGKQLTVEFRDRLRPEMRFGSLDELKRQIQIDASLARARLSNT